MRVPLTTNDFIDRAELVYGDRIGVVDEPIQPAAAVEELTYREMARRGRAIQAGLDELGVPEGARVAVVSHNSARLLELLLAVPSSGRILVPVNFRLQPEEVAYIVGDCEADVILIDPELDDDLIGVGARHRFVLGADSDRALLRLDIEPRRWQQPDEDATATLNYTSGTTAKPKGVRLTHRNIWINSVTFGMHMQVSDRDVLMHVLPMFHCNGWGMPYTATGLGIKQVVLRKVDGAEILRRVDEHGVTLMCGAPTVWNMVLDAAQNWEGEIPGRGQVRLVVAGAPPPSRTIARIEEELGWQFNQIYGLTETSPLLTVNRSRAEYDSLPAIERAKMLSKAGAPSLGTRLCTDADGEILVASNTVMDSYWNNPQETAIAMRGGQFHTGDGGSIDAGGYLTISDRKKDVIITGGENVSSIEVEDVLFTHPAVAEVAVIAVPDDKWGEMVTALVVLRDGENVTETELIDHTRHSLAGYKIPKQVLFTDSIPRTATGKVQKFRLRAEFWTGGRQVN
ncbi:MULTISPECIES: AMP-binding protein [unclassified Rhodococcus (in: high G+C Gram-positive bacteria)]|uniref:AMP-binding protein n=1 Tax=unclassified Rhodococcus (in: high G+C Gram-positive bacteria) TaxID=192944 RepID=UPI0002A4099E|nr:MULTISPECIES: AMP-binding protein [unclassified Rhodococcus (in: high G+C Gram-positive bacteria)]ELB94919.1 acyl-CoA synthetase (AMP-forming)/AMP-acid ligase II [Rhodococcus wratislaviensis IFP 2016]MBC2637455.1 AMP-binding protein [Rhodococcus sp. 3A]MBC2898186.1 AMP-binding protein [Rhodococcus sp. 4CII]